MELINEIQMKWGKGRKPCSHLSLTYSLRQAGKAIKSGVLAFTFTFEMQCIPQATMPQPIVRLALTLFMRRDHNCGGASLDGRGHAEVAPLHRQPHGACWGGSSGMRLCQALWPASLSW